MGRRFAEVCAYPLLIIDNFLERMNKTNCWEFKKCGREVNGSNIHELGICPSALQDKGNGIHDGINGGRICWAVAGTLCQGRVQGSFAAKIKDCGQCDFYARVSAEEGRVFLAVEKVLATIGGTDSLLPGSRRVSQPGASQQYTVLVVDDSTSVRKSLGDYLKQHGYLVIEAENGEEALLRIREFQPDIISLDVVMPELDGFETCQAIRALDGEKPTPVIFVTSNDTLEDRAKGFQLGALDFISKRSKNFWNEVLQAIDRILRPQVAMSNLTALVIDENTVSRRIIVSCLEQQGVAVLVARTDADAISLINQKRQLDIIISEAFGHHVNGMELCRQFRQNPHYAMIPIILLCPDHFRHQILELFRAGATDYIVKPCPREELVGRLVTHLETQQLLKDLANEVRKNKLVLDSVGEGIVGLDVQGRITFINPAAARILGWSREELLGQEFYLIAHGKDESGQEPARPRSPLAPTYLEGKVVCVNDDTFWRKDGSSLAVKYISTPLVGDVLAGAVVTFSDITLEKQDENMRRDVERITRHDLKTPLNGIIGIPQLLLMDENLTGQQREFLGLVEDSGRRMLHMINESLSLFKIEKGTYQFVPEPVDILRTIDEVIHDVSYIAQSGGSIVVFVDGAPRQEEQRFIINGEKAFCYSMLANIMKNACEAASGEKITISLKSGSPLSQIAINNKGVVPEKIRASFFDKYVTAGKPGGTGLGTYSAKLFAEAQNGTIAMVTSSQQGTTVTVSLPAAGKEV